MMGVSITCCSFTSLSLKVASTNICTRAGVGCHGTRGMHVRVLMTELKIDLNYLPFSDILFLFNFN